MRPKTIVYFERIIFGVLLLDTFWNYLEWNRWNPFVRPSPENSLLVIYVVPLTIIIGTFVLFGVLTLLVSRHGSKIAMWVLIALFSISFAIFVFDTVNDIIRAALPSDHMIRALESQASLPGFIPDIHSGIAGGVMLVTRPKAPYARDRYGGASWRPTTASRHSEKWYARHARPSLRPLAIPSPPMWHRVGENERTRGIRRRPRMLTPTAHPRLPLTLVRKLTAVDCGAWIVKSKGR